MAAQNKSIFSCPSKYPFCLDEIFMNYVLFLSQLFELLAVISK